MRLLRHKPIRGRVTRPDGSPAAGLLLTATGVAWDGDRLWHKNHTQARTADDGTYEMKAFSNRLYAVTVEDDNWAVATKSTVIVGEGDPTEGVNFRVQRGTLIQGTVTNGTNLKPIAGAYVSLCEEIAQSLLIPRTRNGSQPRSSPARIEDGTRLQMFRTARTDDRGRYSFRVGPGTFQIGVLPSTTKFKTISVKDEEILNQDIHQP